MTRYVRGEAAIQIVNRGNSKLACDRSASKDKDFICFSKFKKLGRRFQIPADDHTRNIVGKVLFQDLSAFFSCLPLQVAHFHFSDHLGTLKGKILIKAAKLHTGPVDIRCTQIPCVFPGGNKAFKFQSFPEITGLNQNAASSFNTLAAR